MPVELGRKFSGWIVRVAGSSVPPTSRLLRTEGVSSRFPDLDRRFFLSLALRTILTPLLFALLCTCGRAPATPLLIAASSSVRAPLDSIVNRYVAQHGGRIEVSYASSGKLSAQVLAGSPHALFLAADDRYLAPLITAGRTRGPARHVARGRLVLWSKQPGVREERDVWTQEPPGRIALANPDLAPYGAAALAYLRQRGLYDAFAATFVYGESVAQAGQFAHSGAVVAAYVPASLPLSLPINERGVNFPVPLADYPAIQHSVVVLRQEKVINARALALREYICSDTGKAIFRHYGFIVDLPPSPPTKTILE